MLDCALQRLVAVGPMHDFVQDNTAGESKSSRQIRRCCKGEESKKNAEKNVRKSQVKTEGEKKQKK